MCATSFTPLSLSSLVLAMACCVSPERTSASYDPVSAVQVTRIEYRHSRYRLDADTSYIVTEGRVERARRDASGAESPATYCAELAPEEAGSMDRFAKQIVRARWRHPKSFSQLEGTGYSFHAPIEKLAIDYIWHGEEETLTVTFSTAQPPLGTKRFSVPEVFLIQRLLTQIGNHRYHEC